MTLTVFSDAVSWEQNLRRVREPKALASFAYAQASALLYGNGTWAEAAVLEEGGHIVLHPYLRRPIPQSLDRSDLVSAFEFGGFWCSAEDPALRAELLHRFALRFGDWASAEGIVTEFIRLNPFLPDDGIEKGGYQLRRHQDHVVLQLDGPIDTLRQRYNRARGKQVRQGQRNGLTLERVDDPTMLCRLLHANLTRLSAKPFYFFPIEFLRALMPVSVVFHVLGPDGSVIGAHMYIVDGDVLFAFLCHADAESWGLRPNDFAYDAVIGWAVEHGFRTLHLGGGAEELFRYKQSFGPDTIPYRQARRVFLPAVYRDLAGGDDSRFFPAYRRS